MGGACLCASEDVAALKRQRHLRRGDAYWGARTHHALLNGSRLGEAESGNGLEDATLQAKLGERGGQRPHLRV